MSLSEAVSQQWNKSELAELIRRRLYLEPEVQELLVGATSLQTVCNLAVALAFTEQEWSKDGWDDNQLIGVFFGAFRLLFVKATQQPLTQGEDLIISIGSRLVSSMKCETLNDSAHNQVKLMERLANQLKEFRCKQRNENLNMR